MSQYLLGEMVRAVILVRETKAKVTGQSSEAR